MNDFNAKEKDVLSAIGKSTHGRVLVAIMKRRRDELSDTDTIKSGGDYGAEVEGRKLFKKWAKEFIDALGQIRDPKSNLGYDNDNFE